MERWKSREQAPISGQSVEQPGGNGYEPGRLAKGSCNGSHKVRRRDVLLVAHIYSLVRGFRTRDERFDGADNVRDIGKAPAVPDRAKRQRNSSVDHLEQRD